MRDLDEDEQHRELYARFGLAVYFAQVFEHGAVNLIVVQDMVDGRVRSQQDFDDRGDQLFREVLGTHVRALAGRLSQVDVDLCRAALAERNRLVHHFWRDEVDKVVTEAGRQAMLDDLKRVRALFIDADAALGRILYEVGAAVGITPDLVQAAATEMRRRAQGSG